MPLIREGRGFTESLEHANWMPDLALDMIGIGERSGSLREMLDEVAAFYDAEAEVRLEQLTTLLEPAILLFMAGIVVIILLAIYMPTIQRSRRGRSWAKVSKYMSADVTETISGVSSPKIELSDFIGERAAWRSSRQRKRQGATVCRMSNSCCLTLRRYRCSRSNAASGRSDVQEPPVPLRRGTRSACRDGRPDQPRTPR
ncbi:MAG: type II secretion system F family protein [Pyrinomonadaceae bacterium]|nr:type II secretion system F family protein [Pyrinomonadaceae bacterium]